MGSDRVVAVAGAPARAPGPVEDRRCLQPILVVLPTGVGGQDLPAELGFGAGLTCWRWWRRWTDVEVFDQLPRILLAGLPAGVCSTGPGRLLMQPTCRRTKGAPGWGRLRSPAPAQAYSTLCFATAVASR